ncbi:alpha/beta fold hydrolase [Streptomyces pseudovenezuelae]|uniref:Pimeloyl-ACP methyl ester carboxylesterase n=1 Tax=Streptomyces pseudovenezuelae TaxID=67350 RepID=A0ABT6LWS5_9ACTN|nr:alpha/beta hydrolase [Streptomyces pseudovenezuelae]MDH6220722.1 pimeloyl-ACP methyl ester carboxylesterase [Streptomyces pseudovenezuelae]
MTAASELSNAELGHSDLSHFPSADGDLAYRDSGAGDLVVLVHPGYVDHRIFDDQIPALVSAGYRVIAPDVRGHGCSANASKPFRWADDLGALLRHLDGGPAVLVGACMGAAVVTDTVLEHPELVRAVVVAGGGTSVFEHTDPWTLERAAESARLVAAGDLTGWIETFAKNVAGPHRSVADIDPELVRRMREMAAHTVAKHTVGETNWYVPLDAPWSRVPKIDVPVLAVHGALDADDGIDMAERFARTVPNGRSVTIEDAGHFPNLERPDAFNAALLDFLRCL